MNVRALLLVVLIYLHLFAGSVSSALLTNVYLKGIQRQFETYKVAKYIEDKYKDKLHLEYENFNDLHQTCSIVINLCKYDTRFKPSYILAIITKESKFNQYALNRNDGGKGLGQLTGINIYWKDELGWIRNPYDKYQNITGILIALNSFYSAYGSKYQAIKHYNGSTHKSDLYAKSVISLSKEFIIADKI